MSEFNYDATTIMKNGFPTIKKLGAVSPYGEMSPFVWKGKLMRLELIDSARSVMTAQDSKAGIRDCETGEFISYLAEDSYYHSAYIEGDTAYVLGVDLKNRDTIRIYESRDLVHWTNRVLLKNPGWSYCNTGLTKGENGYVLLMEGAEPPEHVGQYPYTFFFATSPDLQHWTLMDYDLGFSKERYMGGPWIRYSEGWYYVISVTELPCQRYTNYIYRTKDFKDWYVGYYNPILIPSEEDRVISPDAADITEEIAREIQTGFLSSNADIDMCDYNGKTYINYGVGNQLGFYYMAAAEYDGSVAEFLRSFFE